MSVKVRPYRNGGWEVDITFRLPDGRKYRERSKAPVDSKSGAFRWGQDRERYLLQHGPPQPKKEVPTLEQFASRFMDGHARANQQKPSELAAKESILRVHLLPLFGEKRLDEITTEHVQRLKQHLKDRAPKTVNNALTVLQTMLKKAVEWNVIDHMPCVIRWVRTPKPSVEFYDFPEYGRFVLAARAIDSNTYAIALLGGDAWLRMGEMIGLEWHDVDLVKRQLCVQRSDWRGHVTAPKGGRLRYVPMTARLVAALKEHRRLRSARVLCRADGSALTQWMVRDHVERAARKGHVPMKGVHHLRHTFCSHLAMRGAPAIAIKEAAGHQDIRTTQRYMHLTPAAVENAIRLLDQLLLPTDGEIVETMKEPACK